MGLFKPKLTLEQFAIAITSDVRLAIIEELGLLWEGGAGKDFEQIIHGVSDRLDREVSRGSLTWHLGKLKDSDLIQESLSIDGITVLRSLTSSGREALKLLKKVDREMEGSV